MRQVCRTSSMSIKAGTIISTGSPTLRAISPGWQKTGKPMMPSTPIAEGRTAEIYAWEDHHSLKLYRDWCPSDCVEYESRIAHAVHAAGIPSPAAGEILEVNGRRGLL